MREAHRQDSHLDAKAKLERLAKDLERTPPAPPRSAGPRREAHRAAPRVAGLAAVTFRSTNAVESMISTAIDHSRKVKRWRGRQMALRWWPAGMLEAEKQFRRVKATPPSPAPTDGEHQFAETIDNKAEAG